MGFDIKNLGPVFNGRYKQGYFVPKFPEKYVGVSRIIYRSSWEHDFCKWLDLNTHVIRWSSEGLSVDYVSQLDGRHHKYYPDFWFEYSPDGGATRQKFVVEVKPKSKLVPPERPKVLTEKTALRYKRDAETYVKNMEKAEACKKFCEANGIRYLFLTEESGLPKL